LLQNVLNEKAPKLGFRAFLSCDVGISSLQEQELQEQQLFS
jgi:hypothetical protein